jgi:hypothetical protein
MSEVKSFLNVVKNYGYPNPKMRTLADMVGYNLDNFLLDLSKEIGREGVEDFCEKAIKKISGKDGINVDLGLGEFCNIHINPKYYDENESENGIISEGKWGDSKILTVSEDGVQYYSTIQEIIDDVGIGEWGDLDELIDGIKDKAGSYVYDNCGFYIWWE